MIHNLHEGELGVMALVPTLNSPLRPFIYRLLREARESILMTMAYFAPDDPLIDGLCKAAQRGVRVRLMLPGRCDVPAGPSAARSFYELLLSAGVEIYERQGVDPSQQDDGGRSEPRRLSARPISITAASNTTASFGDHSLAEVRQADARDV